MTSKNPKKLFEAKKCDTTLINLITSKGYEGECSMDERAARCCSIRRIIPEVAKSKPQCKQIVVTQNKIDLENLNEEKKRRASNSNTMKKDEYMYDLAHFLFKISDLLLQVTEYEKIRCSKEVDLRKMLNIVKTDIMKAFLKGKTKRSTMNKIVSRLTYLDKYIQQMGNDLCFGDSKRDETSNDNGIRCDEEMVKGDVCTSLNLCSIHSNTDELTKEKHYYTNNRGDSNKTTTPLKIRYKTRKSDEFKVGKSKDKHKQIENDLKRIKLDSKTSKTTEKSRKYLSKSTDRFGLKLNKKKNINEIENENDVLIMQAMNISRNDSNKCSTSLCRQCVEDKQLKSSFANQLQYCFGSKHQEKLRQQRFITKSSENINSKLKLFNKVNEDTNETESDFSSEGIGIKPLIKQKSCPITPIKKQMIVATSNDESEYNLNDQIPLINEYLLNRKGSGPHFNLEQWIEFDGNMETNELPPKNRLNKKISVQKLRKNKSNLEKAERKLQTDELILNDNGDQQIISMNVLYSKTHVRYIIPDWMKVVFDIDPTPKVLCKQDLDDGVALTSYQAEPDGTIHFTLAYSSEVLCDLLNSKPASGDLVSKLQEIRSIWSDSAKMLYDTLLKEYEEQNMILQNDESYPKIVETKAYQSVNNNCLADLMDTTQSDTLSASVKEEDDSVNNLQSLEEYSIDSIFKNISKSDEDNFSNNGKEDHTN